jgi:hypothetical protein
MPTASSELCSGREPTTPGVGPEGQREGEGLSSVRPRSLHLRGAASRYATEAQGNQVNRQGASDAIPSSKVDLGHSAHSMRPPVAAETSRIEESYFRSIYARADALSNYAETQV